MCLAAPGQVIALHEEDHILMGDVDFGGIRKTVCLAYLPEIQIGEYVMVHAGFALERIDPEQVARFYQLWQQVLEAAPAQAGSALAASGSPTENSSPDQGSTAHSIGSPTPGSAPANPHHR